MPGVLRFARNTKGSDYAIGDPHSHTPTLIKLLKKVSFNTSKDRLFCPGDFLDRGPDPDGMLALTKQPWFKVSAGNHETALIDIAYRTCYWEKLSKSLGRQWFVQRTHSEQMAIAQYLETLPYAMEVETEQGLVGLVHAMTYLDWNESVRRLNTSIPTALNTLLGSRERKKNNDCRPVQNVRAVIVGHMVHPEPTWRGNTLYLDTGAGSTREHAHKTLTMVRLDDLSTFYSRDTRQDTPE